MIGLTETEDGMPIPLKAGSKENSYITHDGVEVHVSELRVRMITKKPTHPPFQQTYPNALKVMQDSPKAFVEMYDWRCFSDLEDPRGTLSTGPDSYMLIQRGGGFAYDVKYTDFDGKPAVRTVDANVLNATLATAEALKQQTADQAAEVSAPIAQAQASIEDAAVLPATPEEK